MNMTAENRFIIPRMNGKWAEIPRNTASDGRKNSATYKEKEIQCI
jgi:hypothetical protein